MEDYKFDLKKLVDDFKKDHYAGQIKQFNSGIFTITIQDVRDVYTSIHLFFKDPYGTYKEREISNLFVKPNDKTTYLKYEDIDEEVLKYFLDNVGKDFSKTINHEKRRLTELKDYIKETFGGE